MCARQTDRPSSSSPYKPSKGPPLHLLLLLLLKVRTLMIPSSPSSASRVLITYASSSFLAAALSRLMSSALTQPAIWACACGGAHACMQG
jgi:hypothetical protein